MIKKIFYFSFLLSTQTFAGTLRILSDRTETHLKPIIEQFEKETQIKVESVFLESGLLSRLEAKPTEADIIITKEASILEMAKGKKLLQPFSSAKIEKNVPQNFRDLQKYYFVDAYRARIIIYQPERVDSSLLVDYESLLKKDFEKKVCIRSGYHDYNISLFSQIISSYGKEYFSSFLEKLSQNLAFSPQGNDREQAKNIFLKKCDLAIINSYYYGMMLQNPEQEAWAKNIKVFFPGQKKEGTFILKSALGLTTSSKNKKEALLFLEYMSDIYAQQYLAYSLYEYPVNPKIKLPDFFLSLGKDQKELKDGYFKIKDVSLKDILKNKEYVVEELNRIHFDKGK